MNDHNTERSITLFVVYIHDVKPKSVSLPILRHIYSKKFNE